MTRAKGKIDYLMFGFLTNVSMVGTNNIRYTDTFNLPTSGFYEGHAAEAASVAHPHQN